MPRSYIKKKDTVRTRTESLNALFKDYINCNTLDEYLYERWNQLDNLQELIANNRAKIEVQIIDWVREALNSSNDREFKIISDYYGLEGLPPKTLVTLGEELGISLGRVRYIRDKALGILRNPKARRLLNNIVNSSFGLPAKVDRSLEIDLIKNHKEISLRTRDLLLRIGFTTLEEIFDNFNDDLIVDCLKKYGLRRVAGLLWTLEDNDFNWREHISPNLTYKEFGKPPIPLRDIVLPPKENYSVEPTRHGERWTPDEDERLAVLFKSGMNVSDMAKELQRTPSGIFGRLANLSLIPNSYDYYLTHFKNVHPDGK